MFNFLEVKGIKVKRLVIFYPTDWQKLKKIIIPMVGKHIRRQVLQVEVGILIIL